MIKDLKSLSLMDILPDSILSDPQMSAAAQALDAELQNVTKATVETLHLPRLDELPEKVVDLLAWQWHVDYYEPLGMSIETKRRLVKESVAWHRMKGTPAAVEAVVSAAFDTSQVKEWYEYGGKPYYFKVVTEDVTTDKATLDRMRQAIETVKNVRSWLEKIEFLLHLSDQENALDMAMLDCASYENELYPWRGRYFNGAWNFTPMEKVDGSRHFNGSWFFDAVSDGDEDPARQPNLFMGRQLDGSWLFNMSGDSRKIFFNSFEIDPLSVLTPQLTAPEKYTATLDFAGPGRRFTGEWNFGKNRLDDTNLETANKLHVFDHEKAAETSGMQARTAAAETYPTVRLWSFNGAWNFGAPAAFDGTGWFGGRFKFDGVMRELDPVRPPNDLDGHADFAGRWTFSARPATVLFDADEDDGDKADLSFVFTPTKESCVARETEKDNAALDQSDRMERIVFNGAETFNGWNHDGGYIEDIEEKTAMDMADRIRHAEQFDEKNTFDGDLTYGSENGPGETAGLTVTEGRWFNGIWTFDGDTSVRFDGNHQFDGSAFCCLLRDTDRHYDGTMLFDGTYRYKQAARAFDQYSYVA